MVTTKDPNAVLTRGVLKDKTILALRPASNTKGNDVTGAFLPESTTMISLAAPGSIATNIDNLVPVPKRRALVLEELARYDGHSVFDAVVFFCHGWSDGIQLGFTRKTVGDLATAIAKITRRNALVPLYCCSTGQDPNDNADTAPGVGEGSFADRLRDALCEAGVVDCRVMGHTMKGHTTTNPCVLFFDGMGIPTGGVGGYSPVARKTEAWSRWKAAMTDWNNSLRFRMPFMAPADIHAELMGEQELVS